MSGPRRPAPINPVAVPPVASMALRGNPAVEEIWSWCQRDHPEHTSVYQGRYDVISHCHRCGFGWVRWRTDLPGQPPKDGP